MLGFYDSDDSDDEKFERACEVSIKSFRQRIDVAQKMKSRKRGGGMLMVPRQRRGSVSEEVNKVQQQCLCSNDVLIRYGYTDIHNALVRLARQKELSELVEKSMQEAEMSMIEAAKPLVPEAGDDEEGENQDVVDKKLHAHTFLEMCDLTLQMAKEIASLRISLKEKAAPTPTEPDQERDSHIEAKLRERVSSLENELEERRKAWEKREADAAQNLEDEKQRKADGAALRAALAAKSEEVASMEKSAREANARSENLARRVASLESALREAAEASKAKEEIHLGAAAELKAALESAKRDAEEAEGGEERSSRS